VQEELKNEIETKFRIASEINQDDDSDMTSQSKNTSFQESEKDLLRMSSEIQQQKQNNLLRISRLNT